MQNYMLQVKFITIHYMFDLLALQNVIAGNQGAVQLYGIVLIAYYLSLTY